MLPYACVAESRKYRPSYDFLGASSPGKVLCNVPVPSVPTCCVNAKSRAEINALSPGFVLKATGERFKGMNTGNTWRRLTASEPLVRVSVLKAFLRCKHGGLCGGLAFRRALLLSRHASALLTAVCRGMLVLSRSAHWLKADCDRIYLVNNYFWNGPVAP